MPGADSKKPEVIARWTAGWQPPSDDQINSQTDRETEMLRAGKIVAEGRSVGLTGGARCAAEDCYDKPCRTPTTSLTFTCHRHFGRI